MIENSGCSFMKCPYWNGKICTDAEEFFNKDGEPVCRYNRDACRETEVGQLRKENATLRATIAENGREIDKKNMEIEHWKGLATHGCSNESECCPSYCMNEAAEAELAELMERLKPVEEVWKLLKKAQYPYHLTAKMYQAIKTSVRTGIKK